MTAALHHLTSPQPDLRAYAVWAVVGHVVLLALISVAISHSIRTAPMQVMQVRLVGVPQPAAAPPKVVVPQEVRTQQSAAPKEPPPETKNIPESKATTKLMKAAEPAKDEKPNPIEAQKRPPVLDKTPDKKKVVKNDLKAKVVKNPEDYMAALNFIDKLQQQQLTPKPPPAAQAQPDKPAGEGPQIQLNLSEQGEVDGIRQQIQDNWNFPIGVDKGLSVVVRVQTSADGNLSAMPQIVQSSGNQAFDNSLVAAVRKAAPLKVPEGNDKFRVLDLAFGGAQ